VLAGCRLGTDCGRGPAQSPGLPAARVLCSPSTGERRRTHDDARTSARRYITTSRPRLIFGPAPRRRGFGGMIYNKYTVVYFIENSIEKDNCHRKQHLNCKQRVNFRREAKSRRKWNIVQPQQRRHWTRNSDNESIAWTLLNFDSLVYLTHARRARHGHCVQMDTENFNFERFIERL